MLSLPLTAGPCPLCQEVMVVPSPLRQTHRIVLCPLQCLNHSDYISSRFLIISYQPPSICLWSSAARGGIATAICHQDASVAWALPSRGSVRSLQTGTSPRPPSHQLINRMYLMDFLPEPSRKWLFGASGEIPGML